MSMHQTKQQLRAIIEDPENRVVALSGSWGTGKSHLWEEVRRDSNNTQIGGAVYASLFGISDIGTIKVKLAEQVLANNNNISQFSAAIKHLNKIRPLLKRFIPQTDLLEEVALLASPMILKGRFVVIDDIERKGKGLTIDHILGFIDEHVQRHDVRFLIIMNTDKLEDASMWETLREKVVDYEVRLKTTPEEAFNIANSLCPSHHHAMVKESIEKCGVVNIRIAKKVIRAINLIFEGHDSLPDEILRRMIPSTVLLAASHYKGIEDGPPVDFILTPPKYKMTGTKPDEKSEEEMEIEKQEAAWRSLMESMGVLLPDDFEPLVAELLRSGLFDRARLDAILKTYESDADKARFSVDLNKFSHDLTWDIAKSEIELLEEAEALCDRISFASAHAASGLSSMVARLEGGGELAEEIIRKWIESAGDQLANYSDTFHFADELHSRIKQEADRIAKSSEESLSIVEVCTSIRVNRGWSSRHENVLNLKTPEDYEDFIRTATPEDRKTVLLHFRQMYTNRGNAYLVFDLNPPGFIGG